MNERLTVALPPHPEHADAAEPTGISRRRVPWLVLVAVVVLAAMLTTHLLLR